MSKIVHVKRAVSPRSKTLWEKASDLIGADTSHSLPAVASARFKRLLNAKLSAKASR